MKGGLQFRAKKTEDAKLLAISSCLIATVLLFVVGSTPVNAESWWNPSWSYSMLHNISTPNNLTDYQINIRYNSTNVGAHWNWSNNGNDLRFTGFSSNGAEDTSKTLSYWIESWNSTANTASVWVKANITNISTVNGGYGQIKVYYGNPSATSQSNAGNVFKFFDNFDSDKWTDTSAAIYVDTANSYLNFNNVIRNSNVQSYIVYGGINATNNWTMEWEDKGTSGADFSRYDFGLYEQQVNSASVTQDAILIYRHHSTNEYGLVIFDNGTSISTSGGVYAGAYGTLYYLRLSKNDTNVVFEVYSDSARTNRLNQQIAAVSDKMNISYIQGTSAGDGVGYTRSGYIDNLKIRTYMGSDPIISLGAEQTQSTNTAPTIALDSPSDASWTNSRTVNHQFTPLTDDGFSNCSVWNNATGMWALNQTNASAVMNNSVNNISITYPADGTYSWNVQCYDSGNPPLSNFSATNRTIKIDTVSPSLVSYTPSTGAVGIDTNTTITLVFSKDMNQSTLNRTTLKDSSNNSVSISQQPYNNATYTAVFKPSTILGSNKGYTVTLTGLTDLAGNTLPSKFWSFTTATSYNITLSKNGANGWNLISLPVVPTNTSVGYVLSGVKSDITEAWRYDGVSWTLYVPNNPNVTNLNDMTAGYGYWINYNGSTPKAITGSGSLYLEGASVPPSIALKEGWNLIGYYQRGNTNEIQSKCALSMLTPNINDWTQAWWQSPIIGYDNTGKTFTEVYYTDLVWPGRGYWIFMKSAHMYAPGLGAKNATTTDCI
ncbi:Uncharacterised protein [uncultured archaeon]|nr:Uncharacterised protein [uncultured archaeon]